MKPPRSGRRGNVGGLALYATFLAAAVLWFVYYFPQSSTDGRNSQNTMAAQESPYVGKIVVPGGGGCRRLTFDNRDGAVQEGDASLCKDAAQGANSTETRMNAIRDAFSKK
jgi:hypothetical protein